MEGGEVGRRDEAERACQVFCDFESKETSCYGQRMMKRAYVTGRSTQIFILSSISPVDLLVVCSQRRLLPPPQSAFVRQKVDCY